MRRLSRAGFHNLARLSDGTLVGSVRGAVVRLGSGQRFFRVVHRIDRGSRPLNLCRDGDDTLYFGEYFSNRERSCEVHIYASTDGGRSWGVAYTFPKGHIRHIHGIYADRYRKCLWVVTGDDGSEAQIACTEDGFRTVETVYSGQQKYRVVSLVCLAEGLIAPSDTPEEKNFVRLLEPEAGKEHVLAPLPGSAFFAGEAFGDVFVATVVEPSFVNTSARAVVLAGSVSGSWHEVLNGQNDTLPGNWFQYGAFVLPSGRSERPYFFAQARALGGVDERMFVLRKRVDSAGSSSK